MTAALVLAGTLSACVPGGDAAAGDGDDRVSLAMLQPPRSNLSPFSDDAFKLARWRTAETLVRLDADGVAQPMLATRWVQGEDGLTWTFTLREDVRFHDGTALDAAAVVTALGAATEASPLPRILDGVDLTVRSGAPGTVEVRTAEVDPLLPQRLSSPQLAVLAPTAYDGTPDPVGTGTGPFVLVSSDGTTGARLDRWGGYWGEPAQVAGIDVAYVPDGTARAAALRTGTADVVEAVPVGQAGQVDHELIHEVPMPRTNTLYLNTRRGPFADPAVRAAARDAVDRARLVADVYEGRADVASGLLGPALPWAADLRGTADYTARLARRAGAATPAEVDGAPITLGTFTDRAELPEVAVLLEQALEEAGFEVTQDVREYQFIEADALDGAFDAFLLSRATVLDSGDPVAYLVSDFGCEGSFNIAQLCDRDLDRLLATAAGTPAGPERQVATMRAEAAVLALDAAVPLLHERVVQGESADVSGVARDPRERDLVQTSTRLER